MEGAGGSIKFGLAGLVAGASTAWVTDRAWNYLSPYISSGSRGAVTQSALSAVAAGALASVMIYGGDKALEMVMDMGPDPLFRQTYYQAAFLGSSTARSAVSSVQIVLGTLITPPAAPVATRVQTAAAPYTAPPKAGYGEGVGPVMQPPPMAMATQRRAVPNCSAGQNCGSIML
jgi:hypothetical protein